MRRPFLLSLAVALMSSSFSVPAAIAAPKTIYVAPSGGSDHGPGSFDQPYATFKYAVRQLRPGDTLKVRGGTYTEWIGWGITPGTADAPITVEPFEDEYVLVKGTLQFVRANHWKVRRINVTFDPDREPTQFLVKFSGGIGWEFTDAEVWGSRGVSNLMVNSNWKGEPRDYLIARNCIHHNMAQGNPFMNDHNIYLMPGYSSGPGIIERNILFRAPNGNNIKAAGSDRSSGASKVTIRYNTMTHAGQGMVAAYGTHDVKMVRNLITHRKGGYSSYPAIRGFKLWGKRNAAGYNAVYGYDKQIFSKGGSQVVKKAPGNRWVKPWFDQMDDCNGFHPSDPTAAQFGRWA
jgi:hypothetical protein